MLVVWSVTYPLNCHSPQMTMILQQDRGRTQLIKEMTLCWGHNGPCCSLNTRRAPSPGCPLCTLLPWSTATSLRHLHNSLLCFQQVSHKIPSSMAPFLLPNLSPLWPLLYSVFTPPGTLPTYLFTLSSVFPQHDLHYMGVGSLAFQCCILQQLEQCWHVTDAPCVGAEWMNNEWMNEWEQNEWTGIDQRERAFLC